MEIVFAPALQCSFVIIITYMFLLTSKSVKPCKTCKTLFSFFNSLKSCKTCKLITLKLLIRDTSANFGIRDWLQSPDIGQNSSKDLFSFQNSGHFLNKNFASKNCHYSRVSNDIDMKLGPLSKLGKKNMMTSKTFDGDVKSRN